VALSLFCAAPVPISVYLLATLPPNGLRAFALGAGAVLCSALQFALTLRIIQLSWIERLKLLDVCVWVVGSFWVGSLMPSWWQQLIATVVLLALYPLPEWMSDRWRLHQ
jgi:hypothetical protein